MSTLTKNEREALEDVFRSIKTSSSRYRKIKYFLMLWIGLHLDKKSKTGTQNVKTGKFGDKLTKISNVFTKVKKNLSK